MTKKDTPIQTPGQLVRAAADILLVFDTDLMDTRDSSHKGTENRYMVFALMEKAGYTHQQIADHFKMNRENITKALTKLATWLDVYKDLQGTYNRLITLALK